MLVEMTVWGARNSKQSSIGRDFTRRFETDRAQLIAEIQEQIREESGAGERRRSR
jgi:hypothetical protein